jgi:hypothetical protein
MQYNLQLNTIDISKVQLCNINFKFLHLIDQKRKIKIYEKTAEYVELRTA